MSLPDVASWLTEEGHVNREGFISWVEECEDEDALEEVLEELYETRDHLLEELRKPAVQARLFPRREGLPTRKEREREAFKPFRLAGKLKWEIRHEYTAREVGIGNYSRVLFIEGKADDYFVYKRAPDSEYDRERHERMLEARRAFERTYAEALA
jgi:hypothetical protein